MPEEGIFPYDPSLTGPRKSDGALGIGMQKARRLRRPRTEAHEPKYVDMTHDIIMPSSKTLNMRNLGMTAP